MKKIFGKNSQKGYTLVELAISTSILAMLAVGGLSVMGKKNEADNIKETYDKLAKIESTLKSYIRENNFVPCPSAPLVPSSNQLFGYSVAYNTTSKICSNDASDDGTGDTDINISGGLSAADILTNSTGAVPVRTLGLPDDYMYDGWDRKFTYRISDSAGASADFNLSTFHGDIAIVDRKGINKTDINNLPPNNNGAVYVIISHGNNGKDVAWKKNSTTAPSGLATGAEKKNTNHATKSYVQAPKTETFDDIVEYGLKKDVIQPYNALSPIDLDQLTCENAAQLLKEGRISLNAFATSTTTALADQVYSNALKLSKLCESSLTERKLPSSFRGLTLWFDSDDNSTVFSDSTCATLAVAGSNTVGCWQDKSGNNNNATQSVAGSRPPYTANQINSKNALVPASDHMTISDSASLDSIQNNTFFFVSEPSALGNASIFNKRPSGTPVHFLYALSATYGYQQFDSNLTSYFSSSPHPIGRASILTWSIRLSSPVKYFENGEKLTDSSSSIPASLTPDNNPAYLFADPPGSSYPFNGKVGEVILYNTTLSDTERGGVELYLADKWNIALNTDKTELCAAGMEFIKSTAHPEGACQCKNDSGNMGQELTKDSACFYGKAFNKCVSTNAPQYKSPPQGAGLALWLDGNDCTTITLTGNSGAVTKWADKSPNKFDATPPLPDSSNKPTYTPKATNSISTLNFDGTDDVLTLGSNYIYSNNDGLAIFATARSDKSGSDGGYIFDFGFLDDDSFGMSFTTSLAKSNTPTNHGGDQVVSGTLKKASTDFTLLNMDVKFGAALSGKLNLFMDGNNVAKTDISNTQLTNAEIEESLTRDLLRGPVTIGTPSSTLLASTRFFDGDIGEVIVYDKKLTNYESLKIENYLADKWGVVNRPDDISSLELWLDANDLTTLFTSSDCTTTTGLANNAAIGCWKDKSKNSNNAIHATPANRPLLLTSSINSKPALDFNGTNHYLTITNHASLDIINDFTIFTVVQPDVVNTPSRQGIFYKSEAPDVADEYCQYCISLGNYNDTSTNKLWFQYYGPTYASPDYLDGNQIISATTPYLASASVSSGNTPNIIFYINGENSPNSIIKDVNNRTGEQIIIGANNEYDLFDSTSYIENNFNGKISEILFFSKELSTSEREYVEQYLGYKWGITINQ